MINVSLIAASVITHLYPVATNSDYWFVSDNQLIPPTLGNWDLINQVIKNF